MKHYVGLDVSEKVTFICVMDGDGEVLFTGKEVTDPALLARRLGERAPAAARVVLETGPLSTWLWHSLRDLGVAVVCVDARHAKAALSMRINKTDANDAEGLAQLARSGWCREVRVKSLASHLERSLLASRERLVRIKGALSNQIRGQMKLLGLKVGAAGGKRFEARVHELLMKAPELRPVIEPLLEMRGAAMDQIARLDKEVRVRAAHDRTCRRLMTVPGVGALTAMAFKAAVDRPQRFTSSAGVAAYLGLTPRRYQSGEIDIGGRISKRGDRMTRHLLYEAANSVLGRLKRNCLLKAWGLRLAKRAGARKARVAVARKLAVILYRVWADGGEFRWTQQMEEALT